MKVVVQKDMFGCGVASVACLLSITYAEALSLFENGKTKAISIGFLCKDIVGALKNKNINYQFKYIKPRFKNKIYKHGTIVFIKRSKRFPVGHYLCRKNNLWADSWINFPNKNKRAGFRKRLPGKPIYLIYPL